MSNRPPVFTSYKRFMIETYGAPLYRVPVDLGLGCPHRRRDGTGGCTFCPPHGSRSAVTSGVKSLEDQVHSGVAFARRRYRAQRFMLYIQAFTGTFATEAKQRELYDRALETFPFEAVSIGTRPDCLSAGTLDLLEELKERLDVWIELGVQTVHDRTLKRIRRGHTWARAHEAILELHRRSIRTAAHVILGLPGEGPPDFSHTADTLGTLPVTGIKIHNLHVIRGSDMAHEYEAQPFPTMNEEAYATVLIDFLRRLPPAMPIMRINTDTLARELIAPLWDMHKGQFRTYVEGRMRQYGYQQGDLFSGARPRPGHPCTTGPERDRTITRRESGPRAP